MRIMNRRSGLTLLELMIYIAIFSVMFLGFSKQMSSLINQYTVGKSTTKQQIDARDIISILTGEIQNMGLKIYCTAGGVAVATGVMVSESDKSSFVHKQGNPNDTLTFYKAELDNNGVWTNITDTVQYYVNGTSLTRNFRATGGIVTSGVIAENVYAIQFLYGSNATNTVLFDQSTFVPASWTLTNSTGTAPTKTNGTNNALLSFSAAANGKIKYETSLAILANQKYLIDLTIIPSGNFPKNIDSLNFSFRKTSNNAIVVSEKFLPQKSGNQMNIVANSTEDVYACIDYCSHGNGTFDIKGIKVTCIELGTYTWMNNPTATDKQNIKAIHIQLLTRSDKETGMRTASPLLVGDVTVSPSGNYNWRLYDELIETSNNGEINISNIPVGTKLTDAKIRSTLVSVNFY